MSGNAASRWPQVLLTVYWVVLAVATHWPKMPGLDIPGKDKTAHVVAYGVLAGLMLLVAGRWHDRYGRLKIAAAVIVIAGVYGAIDEVTQPFSGRSCTLGDWLADMVGVLIVCGVYVLFARAPIAAADEM